MIDLVKEYEILEDDKIFIFHLKEDLFWSDGEPLTVDDVIFTVKTIQNPSVDSSIAANWLGVTVEKASENSVRFELSNPSPIFLKNCTLKILPKHVWEEISSQNFRSSKLNLKPIGSGPYQVINLSRDSTGTITSLELSINPYYSGKRPNISKIKFSFFDSEETLIKEFNSRSIIKFLGSKNLKGMSLRSTSKYEELKTKGFNEYNISLPRYFSVFFNPDQAEAFENENVRKALNYGTDKQKLINEVLAGFGQTVDSPILPSVYGFEKSTEIYEFNIEKANQLLDEAGFIKNESGIRQKQLTKTPSFQFTQTLTVGSSGAQVTKLQECLANDPAIYPEGKVTGYFGSKTKAAVIKFQEKYAEDILTPSGLTKGNGVVKTNTRKKLNEICAPVSEETLALSFTLTTYQQLTLIKVASFLKEEWAKIGVEVIIDAYDVSNPEQETILEQEIIAPRNYEMILLGEVLGEFPDPYPFWHSSQVTNPGLNLALYKNQKTDKILEDIRLTPNLEERVKMLEEFQNLLIKDAPCVFLYTPDYIYLLSDEIRGMNTKIIADPSNRFSGIENWYIKTKRIW